MNVLYNNLDALYIPDAVGLELVLHPNLSIKVFAVGNGAVSLFTIRKRRQDD